jgi:sugar phosphate isomerase/epimerase
LWESKRIPLIDQAQKEHSKRVVAEYDADVVALSPGLFIATEADDKMAWQEIGDKLRHVAEVTEREDLTLAIEPLAGNYFDSGLSLSRVVRQVNSEHLRVNWDTANVAYATHTRFNADFEPVIAASDHNCNVLKQWLCRSIR